ncbi:hypothetical protein M973_08065 [Francisella orientalis LADL 07-285A]|nr:hypothetical protein M973_08065 [Francisella orientalis LADL 07-285A]
MYSAILYPVAIIGVGYMLRYLSVISSDSFFVAE